MEQPLLKGDRVRWSDEGFRVLGHNRAYRQGTVRGWSRGGAYVRVLWDGLKPTSVQCLHPDFVEPVLED
jgi:hypothetical protein